MTASLDEDRFCFLTATFELVTVQVGQDGVGIPVYRELLSSVSPYFRNAFDGRFQEAADSTIPLLDTSEEIFRIFLQWAHAQLYSSGCVVHVPDLSILPHSFQIAEEASIVSGEPTAGATIENVVDDTAVVADDRESDSGSTTEAKLYFEDETWVQHHNMSMMSFLNLYIFADKYSVHQLRDDIITALLCQSNTWGWHPDPTFAFLSKAYSNLPTSAKLLQLLVDSTAVYWLGDPEADLAVRVRDIHKWQPHFAFEVSLTQAKMLQAFERGDIDDMGEYADKAFENSCSRHEHVLRDEDACRARIGKKAHVFATLIEACAKDAISMVREQEKEDNSSGPADQTEQFDRQ